ncbi:MAG: hypothetical protein QF486_06615 [Candidatus Woesearchaeota archaeon]|nr:hypothetical protein [Candidatus Woesearchaeota archaeon]MDP7199259.1 hypothetical protein [Candidatus Woesearchaeota archaeon]|tara:strand:- start:54 stop:581 length:528 start_codon:yes stop_codon:yes gene_type:complete
MSNDYNPEDAPIPETTPDATDSIEERTDPDLTLTYAKRMQIKKEAHDKKYSNLNENAMAMGYSGGDLEIILTKGEQFSSQDPKRSEIAKTLMKSRLKRTTAAALGYVAMVEGMGLFMDLLILGISGKPNEASAPRWFGYIPLNPWQLALGVYLAYSGCKSVGSTCSLGWNKLRGR